MGLFSALDNAGGHVFGWETEADENRIEQSAEAKRIAQQQQAELARQNSGLNVGSFDSPAITQCINWGGRSHADIYKTNQESIDQAAVAEVAQAWTKLAEGLRERGERFGPDLSNIVRDGWQGEAADAAAEVGKPASEWMKASADAVEMTGNNLNTAGDAAGQSRKLVPEPEGFSWGEAAASAIPFGLSGGGVNALSQMEEQEEAEKAAQETMGRVYSPTLTQVDAKMPQYTVPDGSTTSPPPVAPPGGTDWGGGMGDGGNVPGGSGAGSGAGSGGYSGSGVPGGGIPGGGYSGGAYPGGSSPAGTGAAWANPPGGGLPGGGLFGGGAPGGGTPGGGAGLGLAAGLGAGAGAGMGAGGRAGGVGGAGAGARGAGAGMGAGGRAGAGGLGAGAGAGAGAAGAGGRGAAGRGGMGGMGAGAGRRGEGSEDDEHERPSWLEEQDDVWMNDMPKTAPPVLGE